MEDIALELMIRRETSNASVDWPCSNKLMIHAFILTRMISYATAWKIQMIIMKACGFAMDMKEMNACQSTSTRKTLSKTMKMRLGNTDLKMVDLALEMLMNRESSNASVD